MNEQAVASRRAGRRRRDLPPEARLSRSQRLVVALSYGAPLLVIAWSCLGAARAGWWPILDDARTAIRILDVLRGHFVLVGAQSSTGLLDPQSSSHHPGPAQFYLQAPFVLLAGPRLGLLLGMALLHGMLVVACVRAARLLGGARLAAPVAVGAILLPRLLGYAHLYQPVNTVPPIYALLLLPLAGMLVAQGNRRWLAPLLLAATIAVQGQLAYGPPVVATLICVGVAAFWCRDGSVHADRSLRTVDRLGVALAALLWLPPLVDVLVSAPSNLSQVLRYVASSETGSGATGQRLVEYLSFLAPAGAGFGLLFSVGVVIATVGLAWRTASQLGVSWTVPSGRASTVVLLPAISIFTFVVDAALLAALVPSGEGVWTTAYWETPLRAAGLVVWSALVWLTSRQLRALLGRRLGLGPMRMTGLGAGIIALVSAMAVSATRSVGEVDGQNAAMGDVSVLGLKALSARGIHSGPLRVSHVGGAFTSPVWAVSYRLMAAGHLVCNDIIWPVPEDTDYRRWDRCPVRSPAIVAVDAGHELVLHEALRGATVTSLGTTGRYAVAGGSNAFDVYLLTYP